MSALTSGAACEQPHTNLSERPITRQLKDCTRHKQQAGCSGAYDDGDAGSARGARIRVGRDRLQPQSSCRNSQNMTRVCRVACELTTPIACSPETQLLEIGAGDSTTSGWVGVERPAAERYPGGGMAVSLLASLAQRFHRASTKIWPVEVEQYTIAPGKCQFMCEYC